METKSIKGENEEGIHRAWTPSQACLKSVLSACGNDDGRIRPPLGRGILKTLITPASRQYLSECNHRLIGY